MLFSQSVFLNLVPGGWCWGGESLLTVLCPWEAGVSCCLWLSTSEMAACLSSGCLWHRTGFSVCSQPTQTRVTGVLLRLGMEAVSCRPRLHTPSVDAPAGTLHQCHVSLSLQVAWVKPCAPPSWASPASPSLAWPCPTCPAAGSQLSCWGCLALTRMPSCRQWGQLCPSPGMPNRWEHLVLCNEELRSERLRQAKVLYVESSNKNTSLKNLLGFNLFFSLWGLVLWGNTCMFRALPLCTAPSHFKPKARRMYPMSWVVLKWNEMFQLLGNQQGGEAQLGWMVMQTAQVKEKSWNFS